MARGRAARSASTGDAGGRRRRLLSGISGAAERSSNFATYYQMKERAGDRRARRRHQVLASVRAAAPGAEAPPDRPQLRRPPGHRRGPRARRRSRRSDPDMTLLQAAFSHNGFAPDFDGKTTTASSAASSPSKQVAGPMLITHTNNDQAVGIAYPLASLIAGQDARGARRHQRHLRRDRPQRRPEDAGGRGGLPQPRRRRRTIHPRAGCPPQSSRRRHHRPRRHLQGGGSPTSC